VLTEPAGKDTVRRLLYALPAEEDTVIEVGAEEAGAEVVAKEAGAVAIMRRLSGAIRVTTPRTMVPPLTRLQPVLTLGVSRDERSLSEWGGGSGSMAGTLLLNRLGAVAIA
jgi:hypothetical protein